MILSPSSIHTCRCILEGLRTIPYSGKLLREKTLANWWNHDFRRENFRGLLTFAAPKDATPQISQRKLSRITTKPQNSRKFSPSKVFRYTVWFWALLIYTYGTMYVLTCTHAKHSVTCGITHKLVSQPRSFPLSCGKLKGAWEWGYLFQALLTFITVSNNQQLVE